MDLCIVPKGFKVAHTLYGVSDGLLIEDTALDQFRLCLKAAAQLLLQNLQLDTAHELDPNLLEGLVPGYMELWLLLLQLL
jgi:hypothetical protein